MQSGTGGTAGCELGLSDMKNQLLHLIVNENVSAIEILVDRLEISSDEVNGLIDELIEEGRLTGTRTEDGRRFFKSEVKLSDAPTIEREDMPPDFLTYNSRPPIIIAIIGFIVIGAGFVINAFATDFSEQNFAAILILIGLLITMAGLYCLSQRKTPD